MRTTTFGRYELHYCKTKSAKNQYELHDSPRRTIDKLQAASRLQTVQMTMLSVATEWIDRYYEFS